jgi:integrase
LYLGQRLGDLAELTWRAVDFETGEIAFTARKTGRRIVLRLVQPLVENFSALPSSDNPNAYIFPNSARHKRTASLSNHFREILGEPASLNRVNTKQPERGGHTRVKRDIVPQFATQCSDEAESSERFGFYRA